MGRPKTKIIKEEIDPRTGKKIFKIFIDIKSAKVANVRVQRHSDPFDSYEEAEAHWAQFFKGCYQRLVERENLGETFEAMIDAHELAMREGKTLDPVNSITIADRISILRDWGKSLLRKPAKAITPYDILTVMQAILEAGRSHSRAITFKVAVNQLYKWAISSGFIKEVIQSPAQGVNLRRKIKEKQKVLTEAEVKKLMQSAKEMNHPWYSVWAMALMTGMRSGELYALQWTDIDMESGVITVSKSYNARIKGIKGTKSDEWRNVPINGELKSLLIELRASNHNSEFVLPRLPRWDTNQQAKILRVFCLGIGITSIRFHDQRAIFATGLLRAGVIPAQVMKICGWKDLETMQRYIRLSAIDISGATDCLKILPTDSSAEVLDLNQFRKKDEG